MRIATLGPEGTFSHQATLAFEKAHIVFAHSIEDVFDVLFQDLVDGAVVPLENSLSGTVFNTLDALLKCEDYTIQAEMVLPIEHHLVSFMELKALKKLYAHPHSYEQCKRTLETLFMKHSLYEEMDVIYTKSNVLSAQHLLKDKKGAAAILSEYAARLYKIPILKKNIQDTKNNQTRFVLLGKQNTHSTGEDRTSLILIPKSNRKGLLSDLLLIFSKYDLNLTKIESRPSKKQLGEYIFYLDFEGHIEDKAVQSALSEVQSISPYRFLGSYPRQF